MKFVLTTLLLLCSLGYFAQEKTQKIPKKIRKSIPLLTAYLTQNIPSEKGKVEAIYTWITHNIEYDYDLLQSEKYFTGVDPSINLKTKKAICSGYVELMKAMLDEIHIKSETVDGYIHNMHWMPGKLAIREEHAWIAIRIDEKWELADPTWDAGYIGRIPTNLKPYKAKAYKKTTFKTPEKEAKVLTKREKKEASRKKSYDEKSPFKDKIGFVRAPKKELFLIPTDTFLLTHLPIIPMWQLRDNAISIYDFALAEDSLRAILDHTEAKREDFILTTNDFIETNYLDQRIVYGEQGSSFNNYNPSIKAIYYYNYMELINNKNIQKLARGSEFEIEPSKYDSLSAKADTISKYTKIYKELEKEYFKQGKEYDKAQNKLTVEKDKVNSKLLTKVQKLNEKMLETLAKDEESITANLEKTQSIDAKIAEKYPLAMQYEEPKELKKQAIAPWIDSLTIEIDLLKNKAELTDTLRAHSKFNNLISNTNFIEYLLQENANYIPFNSYSTTEYTNEIDSVITAEAENTILLFSDSLPLELLSKEIMTSLKRVESLTKAATSDLKKQASENKIGSTLSLEIFLQTKLLEATMICNQMQLKTRGFNEAIEKSIKQNEKTLKKITDQMTNQVDLKLEKYKFLQEETEKGHLRDVSLIKRMDADAKKWKKEFGGK